MTTYTDRVDALAAEALTPDVDGGRLEARREALIHDLLDVLAAAYLDDELARRREQHPTRVVAGRKARAAHLRVIREAG
jgi:hypothetical protein